MTIGFDGKKAVLNLTGIGNYSRRCVNALAALCPNDRLLLFVPDKRNQAAADALTPKAQLQFSPFVLKKGLAYELWRNFLQWRTIRQQGVSLFHGLSNELPFLITRSGCKTVVTIHDLIFLHHPELYKPVQRRILRWKTRYACQVADRIIAVSEMTKRDIVQYYGIDERKISIVYQSYDSALFHNRHDETAIAQVRQRYQLPACYVLCVGTIERRKNQGALIEALQQADKGVHVVLVGKPTPYQKELQQRVDSLGLTGRVHFLNNVLNNDLPAIYQGATLFGYMSLFEGFGIPIIEALASGVPVIAATGSCLEEAGGPHSIYLAPHDISGLASHINALLADSQQRQLMVTEGLRYVERFSDKALGQNLHKVYQELLGA